MACYLKTSYPKRAHDKISVNILIVNQIYNRAFIRSSVQIRASITHTNDILLFVTSSAYHRVLKILEGFVIYSVPNGATA